ncbi:MAG: TonB C-terminal domain-containing protein [Deltaproteobacteria bacterium]|nr:TonB C-terminal domain-containing protein [Deltaproteobacteria bacterium]
MTSRRWFKDRSDEIGQMIFLSIVFHTLVLSIIFCAPSFPPPKLTFGPVYSVHLVSFSENILNMRESQHVLRDFRDHTLDGRSLVQKKNIDAISSVPVRRIDDRKSQTNGVEKAIDEIKQRMFSSVQPPDRRDDAAQDARMNEYYADVWSRIKTMWALPSDILPKRNIETIINVRISRNGTVMDMNFEKRSGNQYFDESTVRAIKKAAPFPPLPESVREGSIELGIRFHPSKVRERK